MKGKCRKNKTNEKTLQKIHLEKGNKYQKKWKYAKERQDGGKI